MEDGWGVVLHPNGTKFYEGFFKNNIIILQNKTRNFSKIGFVKKKMNSKNFYFYFSKFLYDGRLGNNFL